MDSNTKEIENRKLCIEAFMQILNDSLHLDICKTFANWFRSKEIFSQGAVLLEMVKF